VRTIDDHLREVRLFHGLDDETLERIAGCGSNAACRQDEPLFREGEPADTFYVLRHGRVSLETFVPGRGTVTIETIEPGDVIGWSWLFEPYSWHFDARAVTDLRVTMFDGACLRGKCDADPRLGYELMQRFAQVMIERLQATRLRLLDVYGYAAAD
jgi:CRP/FNR family transcriptional regulator, cyclic AMP receptor protein